MYKKTNCTSCYKTMLPSILKESRGGMFTNRSIQYYCSICGKEQAPLGGGMRSWIKNLLVTVFLIVIVAGFLYLI